jgi:hypothetical protein
VEAETVQAVVGVEEARVEEVGAGTEAAATAATEEGTAPGSIIAQPSVDGVEFIRRVP